jgi:1-acyl-sn-glycerol-3-phosphate acyltransferase
MHSATVTPTRREWFLRLTRLVGRVALAPVFSVQVEGSGRLPKNRAFVLLPKHQRWEDIPLLSLAAPRPLYYVAKHELFTTRASNWLITSLGGIPLNRRRPLASRRSLQAVIHHLHGGEGVVVFPEGTYFKDRMGPGQTGMIRLILSRLSIPFIPVGIRYTRAGMRTRVRIVFGETMFPDGRKFSQAFMQHIMDDIARLSGFESTPAC